MSPTPLRLCSVLTAGTLAGAALVACGGSTGADGLLTNIETGSVTLGTKFDQPGLGLRNPDGSLSGLDVDVATYVINEIAATNGWEEPAILWRETPSAQRETLLQNGEVDLIAATYSINSGRAESVNFGGPYLLTHQALLVREEDTAIASLEDLDGKLLCSVTGSTSAQTVKEVLEGVQLQEYDTYSSCTEALRQGNIDAMTTDATILHGYAAQTPGEFRVVEMEQDGEPLTDEYYGVGVAKGDTAATEAINDALSAMHNDGSFDRFIAENLSSGEGVTPGTPGDLSFLD